MKNKINKIISFLLVFVLCVTSVLPNTVIFAKADSASLKEKVAESKKEHIVIDTADLNQLSNLKKEDTTYSAALGKNNAAAKWSNTENEKTEKTGLGNAIAGDLDASKINGTDKSYWIKYHNIDMGSGQKYDLEVAVEGAYGKIDGADGPYISFFEGNPAAIRYSGYKYLTVTYTITNSGEGGKLIKDWNGTMTFWDIDSFQALEIRSPGRLTWAHLLKDAHVGFNIPDDRLPDSSVKDNIVYCDNSEDVTDATVTTHAQQHALFLRTRLTPEHNTMTVRYFSGGQNGNQTNGIFFNFDGFLPREDAALVDIEPNITKKVNGKTSDVLDGPSDTFEYTLSTENGNAVGSQLSSFGWSDTLEPVLTFAGTPSVKRTVGGKTTDVTSWFSISTSGQTIKAEVKDSHLNDEDMNGEFTLHFNAKLKDGVSLKDYYDSGKNYAVIPNYGKVNIEQADKKKASKQSSVVNVKIPLAELSIDKTASKYEYKTGDTVNFTIKVKDVTANAPAYNVTLTDTIPAGLKPVSVKTSGVTASAAISGQDISVKASSLSPDQTLAAVVSCTALESGNAKELYNTARAACWNIRNASGHADDDAETYINSTSLSIDKTMDKYEYAVGEEASFTIKVKNTGKGIANNVVVTDEVPEGMTLDYDSLSVSGLPEKIQYPAAGTPDPSNQLNPELRNEIETRNITAEKEKKGDNGWQYTISHMPAGAEAVITFTASANEKGNGMESQNVAAVSCSNAETVKDDAEFYINSADLSITKKYVNPYKEEKDDNRADNEFRVYEEETGNELVTYVVDVESSGVPGTVAKDVTIDDLTLPDGMVLNYDDIKIVETAADGSTKEFTPDGGDGKTFRYHAAGTPDVTNELNEDKYNETEDRTPVITLSRNGNGWKLDDSFLEAGSRLTITYTAKASEDVNGMEVVNTAKATAANIVKENGTPKTVEAGALVYINSPRLVITKEADSEKYAVGDTVTYTIHVSNRQTGTIARNLVFADDILTEGVKLQKTTIALLDSEGRVIKETEENYSSDIRNNQFRLETKKHLVKDENYSQWDAAGGKTPEEQDAWNPEYIGVTEETSMRIEYQMVITDKDLAGKQIENTASAVSDEALEVTTDESVTPDAPDIRVTKEADKKNYYYGEEVSYHITVTQERESVTAEDVRVKDKFASGDFVAVREDSFVVKLNDRDITDEVEITMDESGDGFVIDTGISMEDSDILTVDYAAVPRTDAIGQDITNTVLAWGSNSPEKQATEVVRITDPEAELDIRKTSDKDSYSLGETGHYTVKITQTADNAVARNVVIKDQMETAGTEISNIKVADKKGSDITGEVEILPGTDGYTVNTGKDLAQNEFFTVTYDVLFKEESLAGQDVRNTAAASADNAEEAQADRTVTVLIPDIKTEKKSDKKIYSLGETGQYTVKVTQEEKDATAYHVVIRDNLGIEGATLLEDSIQITDTKGTDITKDVKIEAKENKYTIETGRNLTYDEFFTITYKVAFDHEELVGKTVPNKVKVTADYVESSDENEVKVDAPELGIKKTSDKEKYDITETGHYIVEVSETKEDMTAFNVIIKDTLETAGASIAKDSIKLCDKDGKDITKEVQITSDETSYQIKTGKNLSYGEKFTVTYDVAFNAEAANKVIHNVAKATAENLVAAASDEAEPVTYTDEDGNALFEAVKTSDPAPGSLVKAGSEITYTIRAKNITDKDLENILIMDELPAGTVHKEGGEVRETGGLSHVTFTIEKLESGEEKEVSFTAAVTESAGEQVENKALVRLAGDDILSEDETWAPETFVPTNAITHPLSVWVKDDNEVMVDAPVLDIRKTSDKNTYRVGETGHYTVEVTQIQEGCTARNVIMKDVLQEEGAELLGDTLRISDTSGADITGAVKTEHTGTSYLIETGRDLACGEKFTVTYDVKFTSPSLAGKTVLNTAKAKADNAVAETDNEVTPVEVEEGLFAVKTAEPAGGAVVRAGQEITYHITLKNTGDADKKNVYVLDEVPALTSYVEGSGGELRDIGGKQYVSFAVPSVAAGAEETVSFMVRVSDDASGDDIIKNTALVRPSGEALEDPWNPEEFTPTNEILHPLDSWVTDDVPVDVEDNAPVLAIEKASDKETYAVGETGHYTVKVSQTKEDTEAENLVIRDSLQTEGAKVLAETIRILDPEGEDITKDTAITKEDAAFQIETGRNLAYGEAFTVTYDVLFESASLAGKTVKNTAKAKADNAKAETESEPAVISEGLSAVKTADPAPGTAVKAGDAITYHIALTNTGAAETGNVLVLDEVPALSSYVEGSGGTLVSIGEREYIAFVMDAIGEGETKEASFQVSVSEGASAEDVISNTALVKPAENEDLKDPASWDPESFIPTNTVLHPLNDWVVTEHEVSIDNGENPRLAVTKTSDKDSYSVGDTGKYTIRITNDRKGTTAKQVILSDKFNTEGVSLDKDSVIVTGPDGKKISIKFNKDNADTYNGLMIATGVDLQGGQSMTVTYNVKFTSSSLAGKKVKNSVTVTSSNTNPAKASRTVNINAKDTKTTEKDTADKNSSDSKTSSVKTSDVLFVVLVIAVVVLAGTVIVYVRKRKKSY